MIRQQALPSRRVEPELNRWRERHQQEAAAFRPRGS
jgi:hypothetical protein